VITAVYAAFGGAGAGVFFVSLVLLLSSFSKKLPQPPEPSSQDFSPATDPGGGDALETMVEEMERDEAERAEAEREMHQRVVEKQARLKEAARSRKLPKPI